jgi:ABC-type polysaccharide/polyol phosphate export permease
MVSNDHTSVARGIKDIVAGVRSIYIWPMLGWQDIKQRYRRSVIGPFWLTLSYGAMIAGMGPLYGRLLQQDIGAYLPYLATSFVAWILISSILTDACGAFIGSEGYIKQVKLPLTVYVLRLVWKNVLIFAHNFAIVIIVMLIYPPSMNWTLLLIPAGVLMVALNGVWVGLLLGLLCARFRDLPQVVASFVQIAFFLTPVMWRQEMLGSKQWMVDLNPLYHFIEIVRAPLTSSSNASGSWVAVVLITILGFSITLLIFSRYRSRVAYWV